MTSYPDIGSSANVGDGQEQLVDILRQQLLRYLGGRYSPRPLGGATPLYPIVCVIYPIGIHK